MTGLRMHWWRGWSGTDHMAHHSLITCLSGNDQWLTGADHGTVHALITWLSCTDHVTAHAKVRIVKAVLFPGVIYGCESWTVKKAEYRRIELWCWRRRLKVPWTARRSNQSILKEINPEHLLEGPMLKLKLQHFSYVIWKANSLEKSLMLGKTEGRRRRGRQRMRWMASLMQWTWTWANFGRWWGTGRPGMLQSLGSQRVRHDWETEQTNNPLPQHTHISKPGPYQQGNKKKLWLFHFNCACMLRHSVIVLFLPLSRL